MPRKTTRNLTFDTLTNPEPDAPIRVTREQTWRWLTATPPPGKRPAVLPHGLRLILTSPAALIQPYQLNNGTQAGRVSIHRIQYTAHASTRLFLSPDTTQAKIIPIWELKPRQLTPYPSPLAHPHTKTDCHAFLISHEHDAPGAIAKTYGIAGPDAKEAVRLLLAYCRTHAHQTEPQYSATERNRLTHLFQGF